MSDEDANPCPFSDWTLYCPVEWAFLDGSGKVQANYAIGLFQDAVLVPGVMVYDLSVSSSVTVDYGQLQAQIRDEALIDFAENRANLFFGCLGHVVHSLLIPTGNIAAKLPWSSNSMSSTGAGRDREIEFPERISIRLVNFPVTTELHDIKSQTINKLKSVRGTVVRVSNTKPMLLKIGIRCGKCLMDWLVYCPDGVPQRPQNCVNPGCGSSNFSLIRDQAVTVDWQRIRLQEMAETTSQGRVPITKDVEVIGDEVDRCVPGDIVTVVGVIKLVSLSENRGRGNRGVGRTGLALPKKAGGRGSKKEKGAAAGDSPLMQAEKAKAPIYDTYIEANSVQNSRAVSGADSKPGEVLDANTDLNMLSVQEMYGVLQVANHPEAMALIAASICPTIYGHDLVKAGLVLALFGGSCHSDEFSQDMSLRSDIHVLIVGDPGLGKSQMLTSVSKLAPRSVFVCGSYSSAAGLTVSIQKEQGSNDYTLEAGALVLANNGIACIDELDKMPNDLDALLEAMEQQQISVAKAGIVCNLPAKATILAAANPAHGHYDKTKTISENLKMSTALLSRFDLIFVLLDKPNAQKDEKISAHIFAQHAVDRTHYNQIYKEFNVGSEDAQKKVPLASTTQPQNQNQNSSQPFVSPPPSLADRLRAYNPSSEQGVLSHSLLNRYISYAKKFVQPILSQPAKLVLQDFYLSLRRSQNSQDGTPVTTRQLESLIRLAEARAKVELREEVTEADARDVIEIMKMSLHEAMDADMGFASVHVSTTGRRGQNKLMTQFVGEVQRQARQRGNPEFTKQELYEISRKLRITPASSFDDFLDSMNHHGYFTRANNRIWKVFGV
jgi:DNA helicase MCM8